MDLNYRISHAKTDHSKGDIAARKVSGGYILNYRCIKSGMYRDCICQDLDEVLAMTEEYLMTGTIEYLDALREDMVVVPAVTLEEMINELDRI